MMKVNTARSTARSGPRSFVDRERLTSRQRLRSVSLNPHVRDPLVVRPARRLAPELALNEPLCAKDGLRISFYGAFRQLLERAHIPLHTLVRTTCYSVYSWYYRPDKPPTSKSAQLVREVEEVLGTTRGTLASRLRKPAPPKARTPKRSRASRRQAAQSTPMGRHATALNGP
jgi:hypothetical protein